jgi:5-methylcytosine-specific restriction endonuclease McrA
MHKLAAEPFRGVRLRVCRISQVKRCGRCDALFPIEMFSRRGSGRQHWCRRCFREYFTTRGARHRDQVRAAKASRRARARDHVGALLARSECADCGSSDLVVLEFDHVGEKHAEVAALVLRGASVARLDREIAACEVVCANCHRRRTAARGGWRRAARDWRSEPRPRRPEVARNVAIVLAALESATCADCQEDDLVVLEFDHVGEKRGNVSTLAWRGVSEAVLRHEITRCVVRCANCHRRRTSREGGYYRYSG